MKVKNFELIGLILFLIIAIASPVSADSTSSGTATVTTDMDRHILISIPSGDCDIEYGIPGGTAETSLGKTVSILSNTGWELTASDDDSTGKLYSDSPVGTHTGTALTNPVSVYSGVSTSYVTLDGSSSSPVSLTTGSETGETAATFSLTFQLATDWDDTYSLSTYATLVTITGSCT